MTGNKTRKCSGADIGKYHSIQGISVIQYADLIFTPDSNQISGPDMFLLLAQLCAETPSVII